MESIALQRNAFLLYIQKTSYFSRKIETRLWKRKDPALKSSQDLD